MSLFLWVLLLSFAVSGKCVRLSNFHRCDYDKASSDLICPFENMAKLVLPEWYKIPARLTLVPGKGLLPHIDFSEETASRLLGRKVLIVSSLFSDFFQIIAYLRFSIPVL